jgi:hypothetical protein
METHLFQARINQQGRSLLLRIKKWTAFFYGCTIVTGIFDSVNAYFMLENFEKYGYSYPYYLKFQNILTIIFLIIFGGLLIFSAWYCYQFAAKSITAIEQDNELEYNNSFNFLLKHIIVSSVLFTLNSLWLFILVFIQMRNSY